MQKIIRKLRVTIRWILAAFFGSTILAVVALRFLPVYVTPLMVIRLAQQVGEGRELRMSHHWVPLREISNDLPIAVIASEDANFMTHHGFDYKAIEHAAERNRKQARVKLC